MRSRLPVVLLCAFIVAVSAVAGGASAAPKTGGGGGSKGGGSFSGPYIEGYDEVSDSWTRGNVAGYAELDEIPYRILADGGSKAATIDAIETVFDHDRNGIRGIQDLGDFALCSGNRTAGPPGAESCVAIAVVAPGGTPPATGPYISGPVFRPGSGGVTQGVYEWRRITVDAGSKVTLVWTALLALGSHNYPGASLHMLIGSGSVNGIATSFGSKDVPIPVNQIIATELDKKINGSDTPAPVTVGDTITVTLVAKTFGPNRGTQDLVLRDVLPLCMTYVDGSASPAASVGEVDGRTVLTWSFPGVSNGSTITVTFQATVVSKGDCTNPAVLTSDQAPEARDQVTIVVGGIADVYVDKTCPTSTGPDSVATYSLSFGNQGTESAAGVKIEDVLGVGLTYVDGSAELDGEEIVPAVAADTPGTGETTLTFTIGTLDADDAGLITYEVRTAATGPRGDDSFSNTATISTTSTESSTTNNQDECTTDVTFEPALNVRKADCPDTTVTGGLLTYDITFSNTGSADAEEAVLRDDIPQGTQLVNAGGGTPAADGRSVSWDLGTLEIGESGTKTIVVLVTAGHGVTLENTVTLTSGDASKSHSISTVVDNAGAATSGAAFGLDVGSGSTSVVDELAAVSSSADETDPNGAAIDDDRSLTIPGIANASFFATNTTSDVIGGVDAGSQSTAMATAVDVNLLGGAITAKKVHAVSQSMAGPTTAGYGSTGSLFSELVINGTKYTNVAPNTHVAVYSPLTPTLKIADAYLYEEAGTADTVTPDASHAVNMIRVELVRDVGTQPRGTQIIVSHAETEAAYPSGAACGAGAPASVSGLAFTASAVTTGGVATGKIGDAVLPPTGGSDVDTTNADVRDVSVGDVQVGVLASTTTALNQTSGALQPNPNARSSSRLENVNVLDGTVTADAIDASCATSANGTTTLDLVFVNLKVNGETHVIPAPNDPITVPEDGSTVLVVFNEQVKSGDNTPNTDGTINAIHAYVFDQNGSVVAEVVVGSAHCDAHAAA